MSPELRNFLPADAEAVNRIALAAFQQYSDRYEEWERFSRQIATMDSLAASAEIIVAELDGRIAGAVAYVAPGRPRSTLFAPEWPVLRMLVVEPSSRGRGIGRALTDECIRRAGRDGAPLIALHTSPIMEVALALYRRMGFAHLRTVAPIHGVPYAIYVKQLDQGTERSWT